MPRVLARCSATAAEALVLFVNVIAVIASSGIQAIAEPAPPLIAAALATPPLPVASPWRTAASPERERRHWPVLVETGRMGVGMAKVAREALTPKPEIDKRNIVWERRPDCLDHALQIVIDEVAKLFGNVLVTSTCRTPEHNRRVGGVKRSQHIGGHAVDFFLYGDAHKAKRYLRTHRSVGGLGYYGGGRFHIDNGPERDW